MRALGSLLTFEQRLLVKLFTHRLILRSLVVASLGEVAGEKKLITSLNVAVHH